MEYNYTHGGDVYRNPIEYDFSVNVNPLGMPLASIQAATEGIVLPGRKQKIYRQTGSFPGTAQRNFCLHLDRQFPGKHLR